MDLNQTFDIWKNAVVGVGLDVDRAYGNQCADVDLSWAMTVFPGVAWATLIKPTASAKNFLQAFNPAYFDIVQNDHNNPNQLPPKGAIAVFGASPKAGYTSKYRNDDGHTGVVDHADANFIYLVQQDGSEAQVITQLRARPWRYTECLGWAVPRVAAVGSTPQSTGPVNHPLIGKRVWFKPPAVHPELGWAIYNVGQFPDRAQAKGFMRPDMFNEGPNGAPGFIKTIIGVSKYANTVTVQTDTWGIVDAYLDGDAQILN